MIPSKENWEQTWRGLDEAYAFEHFFGKTLQEAEDMIHDNPEYYCEDFLWMPRIPFRFYLRAFKNYLISSRSKYNSYAANSFLVLIKHTAELKYDWIADNWLSISKILNRLADRQEFYDPLMKPGKFRKRVDQIIQKSKE